MGKPWEGKRNSEPKLTCEDGARLPYSTSWMDIWNEIHTVSYSIYTHFLYPNFKSWRNWENTVEFGAKLPLFPWDTPE